MNLRSIDLNLLVILDVLLAERSVLGAARRLGLTQSAVSHALRRLRATFGDELLIRHARGMEPTWRAAQIALSLRSALAQVEATMVAHAEFDPGQSRRLFRLRVSTYVSGTLLERVCHILQREAPDIQLQVDNFVEGVANDEVIGDEIHVRLANDRVPLSVNSRERLFEDAFVVVMRREHAAAKKRMNLQQYLALKHVRVAANAVGSSLIDDALLRRGLRRHVAVQVPTWMDVRPIVEGTDLVAAAPKRWAEHDAFFSKCLAKPFPIQEVDFAIDQVWQSRYDEDPGHAWLRKTIASAMK
ncbi:MAG TPA: LysR family transcriptional regulator [Magnetospirillaceae bacterium]|jgi:DNA-binding transcriptional LysR family regulator